MLGVSGVGFHLEDGLHVVTLAQASTTRASGSVNARIPW